MAQWTKGMYGTERLDLGIITIAVSYAMVERGAPTGYQYRYGSFTSKKLYATSDEAKAAAIQSVDVRLAAARREIAEMRIAGVSLLPAQQEETREG